MTSSAVQRAEEYAHLMMSGQVAHDFEHVDRVRRWALRIAAGEGHADVEVVEVTALLHDIGRGQAEHERDHGVVGAELAAEFLRGNALLPEPTIVAITYAIAHHSWLDGEGVLLDILRDADRMDMFGAIGLLRAFTSRATMPAYPSGNAKGDTWGMSADAFTARRRQGLPIGEYIVDQINLQMAVYESLVTATARQLAGPLIAFMREYMWQLEREVTGDSIITKRTRQT